MVMPGRQFTSSGGDYRYGFGGHEKDEDVKGTGNWYTFGNYGYDPRIVQRPSPDPESIKHPNRTPYSVFFNNPINVIDPDGRDGVYIAFPDYKADGYSNTGHAGVLLIDNKTGLTKYYEYGRYDDAEIGIVKHYSIPDAIIGADGRPTAESLNKILTAISQKSGNGQRIEGAYFESDKFKEMNEYAQGKLKENADPNRDPYSVTGNNCGTFACDVVNQDADVNTPYIVDPRPVSIVEEYQDNLTPIKYNPGEGTTIKYDDKTVNYNSKTGETSSSQSFFQKLFKSSNDEK
jgi:hypothetical protein